MDDTCHKPYILQPANRQPPLSVMGCRIAVLAEQGQIPDQQITVQSGGQGMGPPPHSHEWDESFYVMRGQVEFNCGGQAATCSAGAFVHVPAGTVHAFQFGPDGGEMLEITGKGSQAVAMFRRIDSQAAAASAPPPVADVVRVLGEVGVKVQPM